MKQIAVPPLSKPIETGLQGPLSPQIVVGIVGASDSGKTELAVGLIRQFKLMSPGLRVAAIKHCPHGHDADRAGSDTSRLQAAGATCVIASSPGSITSFSAPTGETQLETLINRLSTDHDVILVEGYKSSSIPKILVDCAASPRNVVSNVVATAGSTDVSMLSVPNFAMGDTAELAEWITGNPELRQGSRTVSLRVDGVPISLKNFPSEVLTRIVNGFVHSLSGVPDDHHRIEITVTSGSDAPQPPRHESTCG